MKKYLLIISVVIISVYFYHKTALSYDDFPVYAESDEPIAIPSVAAGEEGSSEQTHIYTIETGDTFAEVMTSFGIGYDEMTEIIEKAEPILDFTSIRVGRDIRLLFREGDVVRIEYDIDTENMAVVHLSPEGIRVDEQPIEYEEELVAVSATVTSSLFAAAASVGVEDAAILRMADVLAWSIDFSTNIRVGDTFRILYKKRTRDGGPAPSGEILAVQYVNDGVVFNGYRYEDGDGKVVFYNERGESLVKQFLKAPLKFSRITSGYTARRFHPVLGKDTSHRAIDYAAPIGTPIAAVGEGVVTFAGWKTGYGNFIMVRHNGTYSTHYAHLSGFAKGVRSGTRVSQGQTIGYVGSTGWSTGPHLHYEISKHGTLVNPLTIELPAGDPVPEHTREEFLGIQQALHAKMMGEI